MTWLSVLLLAFVAFAVWDLWVGLSNGRMTPLAPAGSYLSVTRHDNPVGFWLATAFNVLLIAAGLGAVFLP